MKRSTKNKFLRLLILISAIALGFPCLAVQTMPFEKIEITPATKNIRHTLYYVSVKKKLESLGTSLFPTKNDKKMYGKLLIRIPITYGGVIFETEGGVKIEESSGNKDLDEAAMQIIRKAAPFDAFPKEPTKIVVPQIWEFVFSFNFTKEKETYKSKIDSGAIR